MKIRISHLILLLLFSSCSSSTSEFVDWPAYQGSKESNQFSVLDQINRENVKELKVAWTYRSGDADTLQNRTQIQCNPLIIDGVLYGSSPQLKFFALDAATGKEKWGFHPEVEEQAGPLGVNRGLAYWTDGNQERLFVSAGAFLFCLDLNTGKAINTFGDHGRIDLHAGLGRNVDGLYITSNTPGIVYRDLIIMGGRVSESGGAAPGHIRAFNVHSGKQEWIFHTIPQPGEYGYETWPADAWVRVGGANVWAGFSLDEERGILYAPTGSASFDFYGGDRIGANLFANCLLALNARTGERIWHFQAVHHDLWDRDLPAPPNLVTVHHAGRSVDAVAQITKSAHIFLFDRETGQPLFPIEEVPVAPSELEGEEAWPTQPVPTKPERFSRGPFTDADITRRTPEAYAYVKAALDTLQYGVGFLPPSQAGSLILPGLDGGGEWGGAAFDPAAGNLIVNASEMPWILQLLPNSIASTTPFAKGRSLYNRYCNACHGPDLKGGEMFGQVPSLVNLKERQDPAVVMATIRNGKGAMPSFGHLKVAEIEAIQQYLLELEGSDKIEPMEEESDPYPYYLNGYRKFLDQEGYPALSPPWGTLNAINLNTGKISWKVTLGEYPELVAEGIPPTGTESYGGPLVTAGGLVFMAGTPDEKLRAFDKDTGSLLWETQLPAAGYATPATYAVDGKQYVVIACGGGKLGTQSGDFYMAFVLPSI